jgi:hypothetical protein
MTDQPLDPAAIKAKHRADEQGMCAVCRFGDGSYVCAPCEPYLLAAALIAERERVQRVRDEYTAWQSDEDTGSLLEACAALVGEGAAEQSTRCPACGETGKHWSNCPEGAAERHARIVRQVADDLMAEFPPSVDAIVDAPASAAVEDVTP